MNILDLEVLREAAAAMRLAQPAWLATVVAVHGSSPRPTGSMALFLPHGQVGSLSGGCVEEELAAALASNSIPDDRPSILQYGVSADENARLGLPCGGHLTVFLQALQPDQDKPWLTEVISALEERRHLQRIVAVDTGRTILRGTAGFVPLEFKDGELKQTFGPRQRLLLIGAGALSVSVAELGLALDYDVMVCDPRDEARSNWRGPDVPLIDGMPDDAVRAHAADAQSLVITLTHDPRIDDMALMEALEADTAYVGALGSLRTTQARRERLALLGLSSEAIDRLHAPVGLDIGSKTPAEIAVSIMAELIRLRRRG